MIKTFSKKKLAMVGVTSLAAVALLCAGTYAHIPSDITVHASTEETDDTLRVFVGDTDNAPMGYAQQRTSYLETLAEKNSSGSVKAVINFDDYYTLEAVADWANDYDIIINRAYMWPKGETGRLALYVENSDIESSLETYIEQVQNEGIGEDPQFAADFERLLNGEYEVFALTVTASTEALEALNTEADCVSYVDVMYNTEAETYAARAGKTVSYIELPAKPDGAL